eukprot:s658_g21.t1
MGREKEPLGMSELGCAHGARRGARKCVGEKEPLGMSELGCADGRCGCKGVGGNGWEEELLGMSELGCADGCGPRGCNGAGGNGWGEGPARDERVGCAADGVCKGVGGWSGRLRTWGEEARERLASLNAQTAANSVGARWVERAAADGVGARAQVDMCGEKKPVG